MARKRNYAAEYARRRQRAKAEGFGSFWQKRAAAGRWPASSYQDLSPRQQARWHSAFRTVRQMAQSGLSLTQAAKKQGTTPGTVLKYMGRDQIERIGRRWMPSAAFRERQGLIDRPERVNILTEDGMVEVTISDANTLSEYARFLNYVRGALRGDEDARREPAKFEGKTFTDAAGNRHAYITDRKLLSRLYDDGRISMEEFYAEVA
jgi:hypothetical protein